MTYDLGPGRGAYVYLIEGAVTIDAEGFRPAMRPRSPISRRFRVRARETSELILVDVPLVFEPAGIWRGRI